MDITREDHQLLHQKYNSPEGLSTTCKTLEGMHDAMHARKTMKRDLGMALRSFIITRLWVFEENGYVYRLAPGFDIASHFDRDLPFVTDTEDLMKEYNIINEDFFTYFADNILKDSFGKLPPAQAICPACGKGWDLRNNYDAISRAKTNTVSLDNYVGKTYSYVKEKMEARSDRKKEVRLIGLYHSPVTMSKNYVIMKGDSCFRNIKKFYHPDCLRVNQQTFEHLADKSRIRNDRLLYLKVLTDAGFTIKNMENSIDPCANEHTNKWFAVETDIARLLVGWMTSMFFCIVIEEAGNTNLDLLGLPEFNLGCQVRGKAIFEETLEDTVRELKRARTTILQLRGDLNGGNDPSEAPTTA